IDAMLIEQIDGLDAQPFQRSFASPPRIGRTAVDADWPVAVEAIGEFCRDDQAVAPSLDRATDQLLIAERTIHLGGVEEGDAKVDRLVDRANRLIVVGPAIVDIAVADHRHAADADRRDLQPLPQLAIFHTLLLNAPALGFSSKNSIPGFPDNNAAP